MLDMMRVFGAGGTLSSYVDTKLKTLIDTSGPIWRWQENNPVTAGMDPASPEEFAKAARIRDLLMSGLALKVTVEKFGSDTDAVEISSGNSTQRLDHETPGPRIVSWSPQGNPEAFVAMYPAAAEAAAPAPPAAPETGSAPATQSPDPLAPKAVPAARISAEGPWALFRLMDKADKQNAGPQAIRATFRSGPHWVTLLLQLPTSENPFGRGGIWSFRCPTAL
jgi:type VI secretion system protein ImpL